MSDGQGHVGIAYIFALVLRSIIMRIISIVTISIVFIAKPEIQFLGDWFLKAP